MADIRINALATTAASTASDDYIAIDGSANGTRKLNAYSPTFGGNLTVSGTTGTIGSNSGFTWDLGSGNNFIALSTGRPTITASVASGNNAGAALSLLARGGGSRRTWNLETDTTEAGDCVLRQSTTEAGSTFTNALYFSAARNATLGGNLTVSGGTISSGSGTLTLNSSANTVVLQSAGTTALTLDSSQNATFAGDIRFSSTNTFDIGQTGTRVRNAFIRTLVLTTNTPAAANSTGTAGTVTWDTNYIYVCTATDTWKRAAIATW